jgi:5-methylcytosine-specific restriction endonuclease McrBC GTP-binding regulatory subunit McrB
MPNVVGKELSYTKTEGIFKRFCDAARANPKHPFAFIIDEINRADLSSVFGELMYGLEYRDQPVSTIHFGPFSIPKNVYIIGTMNTTDKSLVTFDLALRRRFLFMKLGPDLNTLYSWNAGDKAPFPEEELNAFISCAESLNRALIAPEGLGLPEDYAIGQAYFMKIRDFCPAEVGEARQISEFACERLWDYHLEPLIEEYLGAETKAFRTKLAELRKQFTKQEQDPA